MTAAAPQPGSVWTNDSGMSFTVEAVHQDDAGGFTVEVIDTASKGDTSAMGDDMNPAQWAAFIADCRLRPAA